MQSGTSKIKITLQGGGGGIRSNYCSDLTFISRTFNEHVERIKKLKKKCSGRFRDETLSKRKRDGNIQ